MPKSKKAAKTLSDELRLPSGPVDLSALDARATPGFADGKVAGKRSLADLGPELSDWQERLYAEGRSGGQRNVLLVLQGMDTSGKGGVIRHAVGLVDPQGVDITAFKAPTAEEKRRNFLWRIRNALPDPGQIGIFDRSHYEDVLIVAVHNLVPRATWTKRFDSINRFEAELVAKGTTVIKCFLHMSRDEQRNRLLARLNDPTKHWKFNPGDIDERVHWDAYVRAYERMLERCNTEAAPWHVVPSDRKWYRNLAVARLLLEHLQAMDPQWPTADFDVENEKSRLLNPPKF